jgi:hypothetical protein
MSIFTPDEIEYHPELIVAWGIDTGGFERHSRSVG